MSFAVLTGVAADGIVQRLGHAVIALCAGEGDASFEPDELQLDRALKSP